MGHHPKTGVFFMKTTKILDRTPLKLSIETNILIWLEAFIIDRKAQGLSRGTIEYYQTKFNKFIQYSESVAITNIDQIDSTAIRMYLFWLQQEGHNQGGIHACYRALRAFLNWWEVEVEPDGWKNPINKVKAPKVDLEPLEPVEIADVKTLLSNCKKGTLYGDRDKAIILTLLDTGVRAGELLSMNLDDLDVTGAIIIRKGKGGKPRTVYIGRKSRQAVRAYLKHRCDESSSLWVTNRGTRMSYKNLRDIIHRRAVIAGINPPTLHSFRRYFALTMLRMGEDVFTIQKLMGHADLKVLRRYLKQTNQDTYIAHRRVGPVDRAGL
jgi:site-specific recombinase XerD